MSKLARQNVILELVKSESLTSQDDLRRRLVKYGFRVNQATLSRDIHELGLVKTIDGYLPHRDVDGGEPALPSLDHLIKEFVRSMREAQNLLVLRTSPGSAQPVAAALDGEDQPEIVGTVAGDDTILIICPDKKAARKLAGRIRGILS